MAGEWLMRRVIGVTVALGLAFVLLGNGARAGAVFVGPGPGLTGNDTGGIIAYTPNLERSVYRVMAQDWCSRWGRLSHLTSTPRVYGYYVGFVCIDRPNMIH
jgi:hypothetical protein